MSKTLLYICIALVLFACKPQNMAVSSEYISVPAFIAEQDAAIKSLKGHTLEKTLTVEGKSDTKNLLCDTFSLKKELMLFNDIDINKAAYKGVFKVDTVKQTEGYTVSYTNTGENHLPLKELKGEYSQSNTLVGLELHTLRTNLLSTTDEHLKIRNTAQEIRYSVSIHEALKTGNTSTTAVEAHVLK